MRRGLSRRDGFVGCRRVAATVATGEARHPRRGWGPYGGRSRLSGDGVASVRFGRLERRGVLLGLSGPRLAVMGVGVCVAVIAEYTAGATGLIASAPVWVLLVVLAAVSVAGRPALSWVPLLADWAARRALGATRHAPRAPPFCVLQTLDSGLQSGSIFRLAADTPDVEHFSVKLF